MLGLTGMQYCKVLLVTGASFVAVVVVVLRGLYAVESCFS